jgi:hypothetical protein
VLRADAIYLPLHHEALTWAHRDRIRVAQRPDGVMVLNAIALPCMGSAMLPPCT